VKGGRRVLTDAERKAIRLAGELYAHIQDWVCGDGSTRDDDLAELRASIHHVQRLVMAQAAARLHPGELRLMGEVVGGETARPWGDAYVVDYERMREA
jgi:hypothetical protein